MTETNVKLIELRYSSLHVLKLYKNLEDKTYFITLRNRQEDIARELSLGRSYRQLRSARRAIELLHSQLCEAENAGTLNGGDILEIGLR